MPFTALQHQDVFRVRAVAHLLQDQSCRLRHCNSGRLCCTHLRCQRYRTSHAVYGIATPLAGTLINNTSSVTGPVMPFTALQRESYSIKDLLLFRYRTSHAVYGIATIDSFIAKL